ncbi:PspC family transcriptional regulator [Vagococcus penaei]|uniref:PspC family transcriptional regulator n=1 Tax=Vagococcus penaei TaxID=633807 RepID=A0A1Q2D7A9_9ENTE|nr:PspC domain-containing protein [Vagococcus penaei]AQP54316.1 PspC family transcriptional regulator [Vagococcus penaei]RSU05796.1 PspC family transcriptional regulator [Vagococcus penaei]
MKKRLTKSKDNVVISGVLGGIAEYFGIDATIVRIIFVVLTFGSAFAGLPVYIIMALIMPSASTNTYKGPYNRHYSESQRPRKEAKKSDDDDWSDF